MPTPRAPYNMQDAIREIREITNRRPSNAEINDWLHEMNEPFSDDSFYLDLGLPGYTETYGPRPHPPVSSYLPSMPSMPSVGLGGHGTDAALVLAGVAVVAAAYKWRQR